jgi:GT2 family glycosyltransferase
MLDLGIVIVNYKTWNQLEPCLRTVLASTGVSFRVVVVDNASGDGSVENIRAAFPQVHVIASDINGGFSYANNLGLRWLGFSEDGVAPDAPRYAVLLNPDTEVPPDAFATLTRLMDADPQVGIAGPKLVMGNGQLDAACRRSFPTPWVAFTHFSGLARRFPRSPQLARYNLTFLDPDQPAEVDSVVGAYMQLRREVIERIGLLDETFFMYGEDIDWCYRAKQAGYRVMYYPQAVVLHLKSVVGKLSPKARFEFYRAMLLFYRKHYRAHTPLPIHLMVLAAVLAKGGQALLPELRHPTPFKPTKAAAR